MTLGFSLKFPDGTPTLFFNKILYPYKKEIRELNPNMIPKIHTFRMGNRWRSGLKMHMVIGNRTKYRCQFNQNIPELEFSKAIQPAMIWCGLAGDINIAIGEPDTPAQWLLTPSGINLFAANDGFNSVDELTRWFFPKGYDPTAVPYVGQIIHFTDFQY